MKPLLTLLLLPVFLYSNIFAQTQTDIPEFGKVSVDELKMTECAFEKDAGAMKLLNTAKISFDIGGGITLESPRLITEYRVRIKIFDERAFHAANIKIPYISKSKSSKITDVEAYIYYLDDAGKIVKQKVEKKEVFNENTKAGTALNYLSFTFPNLKSGCVIEYKFKKTDKNSINIQPWLFQDVMPTAVSKVETVIPAYMKLYYHIHALDEIQKDSAFNEYRKYMFSERLVNFTMRNVRSFKIEPMMTALKDNLQRIEFTLTSFISRGVFSDERLRMVSYNFSLLNARFFGRQFKKHIAGSDPFVDSVKKLNSLEDKIASVYNYVRRKIEWNSEFSFFCDSLEECIKNRSGNQADMNLFFLNLLRSSGVRCYPLLISTRENGNPDPTYASTAQFNGVDILITIDSLNYYIVDCTQKNLSYKTPPYNVINSNAFLVDENFPGWMFIKESRILMQNNTSVLAQMNNDGTITGNMKMSLFGFAKNELLTELKKKKNNTETNNRNAADVDLMVDSLATVINNEDDDTLVQRMFFHLTPLNTDKIYFINTYLFSGFKINPFRDSVRYSDIEFGCSQSYNVNIQIHIPENFSIEGLPQSNVIRLYDSSILFKREFFSDESNILARYTFTMTKSHFDKEDYKALKTFFEKFYTLLNEEVLLKKKD